MIIDDTNYIPAKRHTILTSGEVIKMLRELKGWTQEELSKYSSIDANKISLIENNKLEIDKKKAQQLAAAFNVHPAIIMFPEYESIDFPKAA
jgi:transcriptional regulator with XRE-family HTH domain